MNASEKYNEIAEELAKIRSEREKIDSREEALRANLERLVAAHVKETGLLKKRTWRYECKSNQRASTFHLLCNRGDKNDGFEELYKLVEADYHCARPIYWISEAEWLTCQPEWWRQRYLQQKDRPDEKPVVNLRFDDHELRIMADSDEYMLRFIKEFDLTIDISDLRREQEELVRRAASVQALINERTAMFPNVT